MLQVEEFIANMKNENQKAIIQFWHNILTTYPTVTAYIKFRVPFYYQNTWVCYLNPIKPNGVELVLMYAKHLSPNNLLETKGRKLVAGISFFSIEEITDDILEKVLNLFEEALQLDEKKKMKK